MEFQSEDWWKQLLRNVKPLVLTFAAGNFLPWCFEMALFFLNAALYFCSESMVTVNWPENEGEKKWSHVEWNVLFDWNTEATRFLLCLARTKCSLRRWTRQDEPFSCAHPHTDIQPHMRTGTLSSSALVIVLPHFGPYHNKLVAIFGFTRGTHMLASVGTTWVLPSSAFYLQ